MKLSGTIKFTSGLQTVKLKIPVKSPVDVPESIFIEIMKAVNADCKDLEIKSE